MLSTDQCFAKLEGLVTVGARVLAVSQSVAIGRIVRVWCGVALVEWSTSSLCVVQLAEIEGVAVDPRSMDRAVVAEIMIGECVCERKPMHARSRAHAHAHRHAHMHALCTCAHEHAHAHTHPHTHRKTWAHTHRLTHAHTHAHEHTSAHMRAARRAGVLIVFIVTLAEPLEAIRSHAPAAGLGHTVKCVACLFVCVRIAAQGDDYHASGAEYRRHGALG